MEWVEIAAKTVEEARDVALDTLGVDEQDAEIEVIEEPRAGFFGKLRGQARVRARVKPAQVRPKVERRERRKRRDGAAAPPRSETGRGRSGSDRSNQVSALVTAQGSDAVDDDGSPASTPAAAGQSTTGRRRRRGGRASGSGRPADREPGSARGEGEARMAELTIDEQTDVVATFLEGLAAQFGIEGAQAASERVDDDTVEIRLNGGDLGLLIGPKGQTLYLIQELARTAVQRRGGGTQEGRIRIDIAGYRQRRSEALARFTEQVAADVLSSGAPKALEPMNPADRKVVHDTANGIDGVRTLSEGEEPRRRVVLLPAE